MIPSIPRRPAPVGGGGACFKTSARGDMGQPVGKITLTAEGGRAKRWLPPFPSQTFPSHASMATGVVAASAVFVALYSIGGTGDVSLTAVASAMIGVHGLIGIGEAVITALTIAAVAATRPDLLFAGSRSADGSAVAVGGAAP